jgi:hypothetical protein
MDGITTHNIKLPASLAQCMTATKISDANGLVSLQLQSNGNVDVQLGRTELCQLRDVLALWMRTVASDQRQRSADAKYRDVERRVGWGTTQGEVRELDVPRVTCTHR